MMISRWQALLFTAGAAITAPLAAQQPTPQQLQELLQQVQQNPEHLQKLMQQAQEMQACLSQLDQQTMDRLRVRGEEMTADVRALCVAGERDMAASRAMQYAQEMAASPQLQSVQACGTLASSMMADLPFASPDDADPQGPAHVCDQLPD